MNAMAKAAVPAVLVTALVGSATSLAAGSEDLQAELQGMVDEAMNSQSEVEVAVHDGGKVMLSGYIQGPDQLMMLEQKIRDVEGVTDLESTVMQSD